jgi:surface protein
MNAMFRYCDKYQGNGLENWDVSKVTTMAEMFYCCPTLKKDNIANWKPKILSLPFLDRTIALSLIFKSGTTHIPKWIRNALKDDKK